MGVKHVRAGCEAGAPVGWHGMPSYAAAVFLESAEAVCDVRPRVAPTDATWATSFEA